MSCYGFSTPRFHLCRLHIAGTGQHPKAKHGREAKAYAWHLLRAETGGVPLSSRACAEPRGIRPGSQASNLDLIFVCCLLPRFGALKLAMLRIPEMKCKASPKTLGWVLQLITSLRLWFSHARSQRGLKIWGVDSLGSHMARLQGTLRMYLLLDGSCSQVMYIKLSVCSISMGCQSWPLASSYPDPG